MQALCVPVTRGAVVLAEIGWFLGVALVVERRADARGYVVLGAAAVLMTWRVWEMCRLVCGAPQVYFFNLLVTCSLVAALSTALVDTGDGIATVFVAVHTAVVLAHTCAVRNTLPPSIGDNPIFEHVLYVEPLSDDDVDDSDVTAVAAEDGGFDTVSLDESIDEVIHCKYRGHVRDVVDDDEERVHARAHASACRRISLNPRAPSVRRSSAMRPRGRNASSTLERSQLQPM